MEKGCSLSLYFFAIFTCLQLVKGNPSLHFEDDFENITIGSSSSTWSVDIPGLTIQDTVYTTASYPIPLSYYLLLGNSTSSSVLCSYLLRSTSCSMSGPNCINCMDNLSSDGSIVATFNITQLDIAKNESVLLYSLPPGGVTNKQIHKLTLTGCSESVGNAIAVNQSEDICGYGCTSRYACRQRYENDTVEASTVFTCGATAEWRPSLPFCMHVQEPTTTATASTLTTPTTSIGSTQDANTPHTTTGSTTTGDGRSFPNSGPSFAAIGGVLAAICIGVFVYMACTEIPNNVVLYAMFAICICVWAVALGLCFGLSTNKSAVIAGIVVGSLALAGMVVVIVFQFLHIKSHKRNGIPGKPEDPSL